MMLTSDWLDGLTRLLRVSIELQRLRVGELTAAFERLRERQRQAYAVRGARRRHRRGDP
jgi:hypothetical protein